MGLVNRDDGWRVPDWLWGRREPLLPARPKHPLGCHNPRVPDREAMQVPRRGVPDPITTKILDAASNTSVPTSPAQTLRRSLTTIASGKWPPSSSAWIAKPIPARSPSQNDEVLEVAEANRDVLIPFVSVDPHRGKRAVGEAERLIA